MASLRDQAASAVGAGLFKASKEEKPKHRRQRSLPTSEYLAGLAGAVGLGGLGNDEAFELSGDRLMQHGWGLPDTGRHVIGCHFNSRNEGSQCVG